MSDPDLAGLIELLAIRSISREPDRAADMRLAADWLATRLAFMDGRVVETDGQPIVRADWLGAPGAPTILVYGHYDVQPPGDERKWETPPFAPTVRDGRLYARGASDDKGPVYVAIKVAEAFAGRGGGMPLNVRFLLEGEEEIGSPSLPAFLEQHRDELAADVVVSADGAMWRASEPSVAVASKGLVGFDLVVTGPQTDLHSGRHGGGVQNPNHALAALLASLRTSDGSIAVRGFYDEVEALSDAERAAMAAVPFDEGEYLRDVGVPALFGEPGFSLLERLWARPTIEVNEIAGGGPFTVIPREARAHLTCRLVPNQRPERVIDALAAHVRTHCPPGVHARIDPHPGGVAAYSVPVEHPSVQAALEALRTVYPATEPLPVRIGGTLPAARLFDEILGVKTLMFSFSTGDEHFHAPNEFFRLSRIEEGIRAWTELWARLAHAIPV